MAFYAATEEGLTPAELLASVVNRVDPQDRVTIAMAETGSVLVACDDQLSNGRWTVSRHRPPNRHRHALPQRHHRLGPLPL